MSLNNLKPGDKLYIESVQRAWGSDRVIPYDVFTVERLTEKQIVTRDQYGQETRFRIKDGIMIGGSYFYRARIPTPEMIADQVKAVKVYRAQREIKSRLNGLGKLSGKRYQNDDFWLAIGKTIEEFESKEKA